MSPIAPIEDVKIEQPAEIEVEHLNLVAQVAPIEDVKIVLPVEKEAEIIHILQQSSDLELRDLVNLEEEMADVEKYLSAEKIRLGDKLSYTFEIEEDALNQKIPPHIIEKLVKNAIQYGVEETANSGYVNIQSFVYDGFLTIEIRNSGQLKNETPFPKESGFPSSTVNEPSETRINIENTIKRLSEMFGENGFFNIENDGDSEVVATMCVPVAP